MPWLVNDWLASSKRKSMEDYEQNGYFLLLNHAWNDPDCCLPDDDIVLARLSELGKKWIKSGPRLRACFEPHHSRAGFIFNRRQFAEREQQQRRLEASKRSALAGAQGRWNNRNAAAMRPHSGGNADHDADGVLDPMRKNASSPLSPPPSPFRSTETPSLCPPVAEISHEIAAYWNTKENLPKVRTVNPARSKKLNARLKEQFFKENWKAAIDKVAILPFCNAKIPTSSYPNGWQADFDWFIGPSAVTRVMEGKYDRNNPQPGAESEHNPNEKW